MSFQDICTKCACMREPIEIAKNGKKIIMHICPKCESEKSERIVK